ncbi:archaeal heat shock protein Hsp14 [Halogeometricum luteum]|uniref:Hsp20/alpha crystallin family protein n=1 Tax=Halogeometricum luteum TaxID=2950537 RepID=A0ABU2G7A9_9EURY|nr:archaeal heat shock protein Hsp14 [Halogeometricum sp. S3BR5-2]MDS0296346.1 Hsp20/alpha crystallin family protein [Halogeometricum sp. S3BR5-2]
MTRQNPFDEIEQFFKRMGREFEESGLASLRDVSVDVSETDDTIVVTADLPGYEKEDIDISASGRELTISAERSAADEESGDRYIRRERTRSSVERSLTLPEEVVEEEASATYNNGVLTVTLPKESADEDDESTDIDVI